MFLASNTKIIENRVKNKILEQILPKFDNLKGLCYTVMGLGFAVLCYVLLHCAVLCLACVFCCWCKVVDNINKNKLQYRNNKDVNRN